MNTQPSAIRNVSRNLSNMLKIVERKLLLLGLLFSCSCSTAVSPIFISPEPVFSEIDYSEMDKGKPFSRHDYFLVKGDVGNKQLLHQYIDTFIKSNVSKHCTSTDNYIMFFYKESAVVNESALNAQQQEYRYKLFLLSQDEDYIASYNCWNAQPSPSAEFKEKYQ
jgi:hypothetical protein